MPARALPGVAVTRPVVTGIAPVDAVPFVVAVNTIVGEGVPFLI